MATSAPRLPQQPNYPRPVSSELLVRLKAAHEQLVREMENMERLTIGPPPEARELSAARWRIGQASLHRRSVSVRVLDFLADRVESGEAARIRLLRSDNQLAMSKSAEHVYAWTNETVARDWSGYCSASRAIRMDMKSNLLLEKQLLYPILESLVARRV